MNVYRRYSSPFFLPFCWGLALALQMMLAFISLPSFSQSDRRATYRPTLRLSKFAFCQNYFHNQDLFKILTDDEKRQIFILAHDYARIQNSQVVGDFSSTSDLKIHIQSEFLALVEGVFKRFKGRDGVAAPAVFNEPFSFSFEQVYNSVLSFYLQHVREELEYFKTENTSTSHKVAAKKAQIQQQAFQQRHLSRIQFFLKKYKSETLEEAFIRSWYKNKENNFAVQLRDIEFLVQNVSNKNVTDKQGYTALTRAVQSGSLEVVELLLKAGADPNARESERNGWTPLMRNALQGNSAVARVLIAAGADINMKAYRGNYFLAIEFACHNNNYKVIEVLLEAGANLTPKGDLGLWKKILSKYQNVNSENLPDIYREYYSAHVDF